MWYSWYRLGYGVLLKGAFMAVSVLKTLFAPFPGLHWFLSIAFQISIISIESSFLNYFELVFHALSLKNGGISSI